MGRSHTICLIQHSFSRKFDERNAFPGYGGGGGGRGTKKLGLDDFFFSKGGVGGHHIATVSLYTSIDFDSLSKYFFIEKLRIQAKKSL